MPPKKIPEEKTTLRKVATILGIITALMTILGGFSGMIYKMTLIETSITSNIGFNRSLMMDDYQVRYDALERKIGSAKRKLSRVEVDSPRYKDLEYDLNGLEEVRDDIGNLLKKAREGNKKK